MRRDLPAFPPPAFDPVPVRARRDGWTPERQRAFIAALAETRCVDRAATAAGMSRESAYRLRTRVGAQSFAAAWEAIVTSIVPMPANASLLWHRAFYGTLKPIVRDGRLAGVIHRPDNKALLSLMHRQDQAERASVRMRARLEKERSQ